MLDAMKNAWLSGCGQAVQNKFKSSVQNWTVLNNQYFCTNFVPNLWVKNASYPQTKHSLFLTISVVFTSVNSRFIQFKHTAYNYILLIKYIYKNIDKERTL